MFTQVSQHEFGEKLSVSERVFGSQLALNMFKQGWEIVQDNINLMGIGNVTADDTWPLIAKYEHFFTDLGQRIYNRAAVLEGP